MLHVVLIPVVAGRIWLMSWFVCYAIWNLCVCISCMWQVLLWFVWQLNVEYHFPEDPRYFDINWNTSLPQKEKKKNEKKKACCFCWPSCT